jgi:formiminotetrahydrofolate cyclodeaminase
LWDDTAERLLHRASSAEPTPGGGAVAGLAAAFGLALVLMAIEVSSSAAGLDPAELEALGEGRHRAQALQSHAAAAVDRDVAEFEAVMSGYRLPRATEAEQTARQQAIDAATITATLGPLSLAETAISGIELVGLIRPRIKPSIVSDADAGGDLLRGAALAALRTADINLVALEARGHAAAAALRQRRDAAARAVADLGGN